MRGKDLTEDIKSVVCRFYQNGYGVSDIAERLDVSVSSVYRILDESGLRPIVSKETETSTGCNITDAKLDRIIKMLEEIQDDSGSLPIPISLEALGYLRKDERTYVQKKDNNEQRIITFISGQQINIKTTDKYGKTLGETHYLTANLIEAMYSAIVQRKWTYFGR